MSTALTKADIDKMIDVLPEGTGSDLEVRQRTFTHPELAIVGERKVTSIEGAELSDIGKLYIRGFNLTADDLMEKVEGTLLREVPVSFREEKDDDGNTYTRGIQPMTSAEYYTKKDEGSELKKGLAWLLRLDKPIKVSLSEAQEKENQTFVVVFIRGMKMQQFIESDVEGQRKAVAAEIGISRAELKTIFQRVVIGTVQVKDSKNREHYVFDIQVEANDKKMVELVAKDLQLALNDPVVSGAKLITSQSREVLESEVEAEEETVQDEIDDAKQPGESKEVPNLLDDSDLPFSDNRD